MKTPVLFFALPPALAILLAGCSGSAQPANAERTRGVPVRTAKVASRDLEDTLVLSGTLRPRAQVQVVAEVSARLQRILRDEGARVAAGEILAQLDPTDYRLSNDRAQAALQLAAANRAHAVTERERADSLQKTGGITDKDRLAAEVALQVAEASLAQARAEAAIAGQQLARAEVRAPFGGRVAKRFVDAGAMLAPGAPLFTLVDDQVLEFRAQVPSADYLKIKVGDTVTLTMDALLGVTAKGRVVRIAPIIDERTRSFELVVEVPGSKDLVGGLFARATIRVGSVPGALVVPPAALQRDGSTPDQADVFVVVAGKAEKRTVKVGVEAADAIQVTAGLAAGDVVVLDPPTALSSGAPVDLQNGANPGNPTDAKRTAS
jgi:membrane fusion protein (multidrug efflux system)